MAESNKIQGKTLTPPKDLKERELPIVLFEEAVFRIHKSVNDPIFFGKTGQCRFDDPMAEFGTLYAAKDSGGAFIETFGQSEGLTVSEQGLKQRSITKLTFSTKVKLVDVTGRGVVWIGAVGDISTGDHSISQQWARALFEHPEKPDGILYRARHDLDKLSIALFDQQRGAVEKEFTTAILDKSFVGELGMILQHYNISLV